MKRSPNRLEGKIALVTGGAGEIGRAVTAAYLEEGATVVFTGRTLEKLEATANALLAACPDWKGRLHYLQMDNSDEVSLSKGAAEIGSRFGRVDILINNAGSAGPQQEIVNIPLERTDGGGESLNDAIGSLLIGPWLTTKAFLSLLGEGASVINVSTIFSRTPYFGRAAYVVPKAALNALSRLMAVELGRDPRRIRVNTIYPGPVETNRIRRVFGAMDRLRGAPDGTTKNEVLDRMVIKSQADGTEFIPRDDVAQFVVYLGSADGASFTAQDFEIARGYESTRDTTCHLTFRPKLSSVPAYGKLVWIVAGNQVEEVCELIDSYTKIGMEILVTFQNVAALDQVRDRTPERSGLKLSLFDVHDSGHWSEIQKYLQSQNPSKWNVVVLPWSENWKETSVFEAPTQFIRDFVKYEIEGSIVLAKRLEQIFRFHDSRLLARPTVIFVSNKSDGKQNVYPQIKRGAMRQLIRTWRHENDVVLKSGNRARGVQSAQLIRYCNEKPGNLNLCFNWLVSLSSGIHQMEAIDLLIDPSLEAYRPSEGSSNWIEHEVVRGLHMDRIAVITGGSEGIGGAITRQLALSGARIVIAERSRVKLAMVREQLIDEMREAGYPDPEGRILILPNCDVTKASSIDGIMDLVVAKFGRIDFLVNNAGLAGAEGMTIDIPLADWKMTISGNLISNYQLMMNALPYMKRQKFGHILNVSSYFGATRHGLVPYTNRSDYAVSKSGQIALVEAVASTLGPNVQINAFAPGPVDGARLNGTRGRPGLYLRRARLILENKRLNLVYSNIISAVKAGASFDAVMELVLQNKAVAMIDNPVAPECLRAMAVEITRADSALLQSANSFLLPKSQFLKLVGRLIRGGYMTAATSERYTEKFTDAPDPFFAEILIEENAAKIRQRMVEALALKKMPSDRAVAVEVASVLAHRTLTGEVVFPSCGFKVDGFRVGDNFGGPDLKNFDAVNETPSWAIEEAVAGKTVYIMGDAMMDEMTGLAGRYAGAKKVVIATVTERVCDEMKKRVAMLDNRRSITVMCLGKDNLGAALEAAVKTHGKPDVFVSFPASELPQIGISTSGEPVLPTVAEFELLVESNITHHFVVTQHTALFEDCRTVFVTPTMGRATTEQRPWIRLIRDTLRPFTAAASSEAKFLPHGSSLYQVGCERSDEGFFQTILLMSGRRVDRQTETKYKAAA